MLHQGIRASKDTPAGNRGAPPEALVTEGVPPGEVPLEHLEDGNQVTIIVIQSMTQNGFIATNFCFLN